MTLDQTDKRIVAVLKQDARISFAALGRQIGLSRTAIQDRVARLETNGIIRGYRTEIGADQSESISAVLMIRIAQRPCDQALEWLNTLPGVHSVTSLSGEIDAIAHCDVPAPADLSRLNDQIGTSELIQSCTSHVILRRMPKP